ncbi:hypothetical protein NHQ30_004288 [Ciborinia camelliae]|nr:hypothetical protein NHQ30_004288 [Ciborinia camelliae]
MEQWRIGRRELFEQLQNVCNEIEQNLSNELVDGDNTVIRKDELEKLRLKVKASETDNEKYAAQVQSNEDSLLEKGSKIKILEEEISRLKEELRSNRNAVSRADRLDEENRLLAEELKKHQNVASGEGRLEQHSKKLSTELSNTSIRTRDAELSSTDNERSSSFNNGQVSLMDRNLNYKELLNEHRRVKEQWSTQKERADKLAETIREKNGKLREWQVWWDEQKISFKRIFDESNPEAEEKIPTLSLKSQELERVKTAMPGTMLSSDSGDSVLPPRPIEIPVTSTRKDLPTDENTGQSGLDGSDHEQVSNEQTDHESPQLPRHERRFQRVNSVEETPFLSIAPYHSSSTQDLESSLSGGGENAVVGEPNMETPKMPLSDDPPEFIFARPVRKRKRNERESQRTPMPKVKVEDLGSSSPIIARILASESLDLDDIGDKVVTPRKRRRAFQPLVEDVGNEVANLVGDEMLLDDKKYERTQAPTPVTIGQPRKIMITPASKRGKSPIITPLGALCTNHRILPNTVDPSLSAKLQRKTSDIISITPLGALCTNHRILPNTVDPSLSAKLQRKTSAIIRGVQEILEDGESTSPAQTPASVGKGRIHPADLLENLLSSSPTPQPAAPEVRSVILPPSKLSTEIKTSSLDQRKILDNPPRCFGQRGDLDRQDTSTSVPEKNANVSDEASKVVDKTLGRPRTGIRKEISKPEKRASVSNERDEAVKNSTSRPRTGVSNEISRPSLRVSRRGSTASTELSPERPKKVSQGSTRLPTESTAKVGLGTSKPSTIQKRRSRRDLDFDDPEQERYRLRPVATLKLDHFKINPNFNHGYDYAYTEVVRGRDRQCLPGCVREECCGKQFGALAQAIYHVRDNPTTSQKAEEDTLLEEYLGDNKRKILTMAKQERKETLAQARKWKLSNTMGKHRSVVPRRSTPPGFWDTDFPNTQEDAELRKKQKEAEREKVAERYAEAMRPGGAWLFKDE